MPALAVVMIAASVAIEAEEGGDRTTVVLDDGVLRVLPRKHGGSPEALSSPAQTPPFPHRHRHPPPQSPASQPCPARQGCRHQGWWRKPCSRERNARAFGRLKIPGTI